MPNRIALVTAGQKITHDPTKEINGDPLAFVGPNPYGTMTSDIIFGGTNQLLGWIDDATGLDLKGMVTPLESLLGTTTGLLGPNGLMKFLTPGSGTTSTNVFSPLLSGMSVGSLGGFTSFLTPTNLLTGPGVLSPVLSGGNFLGSLIPGLDASKIITGIFGTGFIPSLPASKVTSGTFGAGLIPGLDVSKIVSGIFGTSFIPSLPAGQITSGTFGAGLIPSLDASKITSGTLANAFVPGVGTLIDSIVQGFGLVGSGFANVDVQNQSTLVNHTATSAQATAAANSVSLQATVAAQNAGSGSNFNFVFSGSDGSTLAGADWTTGPTSGDIVIRSGNPVAAGIKSSNANHVAYYAICAHATTTNDQSVSITLGDQGGAAGTNTTVYGHCNSTMTAGSYVKANNGGFEVGYFTMSGGTFTYTPFATATSMTLQTGYRVELRNVGNIHYVYINGVLQFSFTDTGNHVTMDATHRQAGFSEDRTSTAGWFGSTTYDSFRVASFSLADYTTGGSGVTTPSWALRRASATTLSMTINTGASGMPSSYFDTNDYANSVTVTTLGTGLVTITQAGFYWVTFSGYSGTAIDLWWMPTHYTLFHNGTEVTGPVPSGTPQLIYLGVGDTLAPKFVALGWRTPGGGGTPNSYQIGSLNSGLFTGYRQSA